MIKRYVCFDGETRYFNRRELGCSEPVRARRIRDKQRMKARARKVAKHIWAYPDDMLHRAEKYADNIKTCSCWMCEPPSEARWAYDAGTPCRSIVTAKQPIDRATLML